MKQRLLLLGLFVCALACDSANPIAPSGTVLSATANPSQISLNGQSTITVTGFKPDANRLNPGTQIIMSTSLGNLYHPTTGQQVSVIEIDGNGQAQALLRADGRSGEASVSATLSTSGGGGGGGGDDGGGGTTTGASASTTVQIGATDTDRPTVVISANPTTIAVGASSRISLLGRNSDNTPVSAGQRIRLTSDLGKVVADGGNDNSPTIDSVLTNASGEAFVSFVAGSRGGTGQVAAILGTSEEVSVSIEIRDALNSLNLTPSPQTIQRLDTPGATVELEAVLLDAQGEGVPSTLVVFESQFGSLDNTTALSNSQGVAQVTLTVTRTDVASVATDGTFEVKATATSEGETRSDTKDITVQGSP